MSKSLDPLRRERREWLGRRLAFIESQTWWYQPQWWVCLRVAEAFTVEAETRTPLLQWISSKAVDLGIIPSIPAWKALLLSAQLIRIALLFSIRIEHNILWRDRSKKLSFQKCPRKQPVEKFCKLNEWISERFMSLFGKDIDSLLPRFTFLST